MRQAAHYLAVDLGASSGRTMVGTLENGRLTLKEINRFWNGPTEVRGTLVWDFVHLFRNIKAGIALAKMEYGDGLVSMGIDTWGVDFGLLDAEGHLLNHPVHYRDCRTAGMLEKAIERVPQAEVFAQTGVQFMEINTLYQLMSLAQTETSQYRNASKLLFSPDLLNYWLTGSMVTERTIASTSQFYNPSTKDWAYDLLERLGIRTDFFAPLVDPGTVIGMVDGLSVVAVGSHDTASAFAAVPVVEGEHCAFLSSGTWSLLGTELAAPILSEAVLAANFTNEVGICGTTRFLKNLSGLWMVQELRRQWNEQGSDYSWAAMEHLARETPPCRFLIDPSDASFLAPGDMAGRIQAYCERTAQPCPQTHAQILRAAYDGLALLYADVCETLEILTDRPFETLRIVGGGSKDSLLNQLAANATGRTVVAGPTEATVCGNLIMQMLAMGEIQSLTEGRDIIRNSFTHETVIFHPKDPAAWRDALEKWRAHSV